MFPKHTVNKNLMSKGHGQSPVAAGCERTLDVVRWLRAHRDLA